MKKSDMTFSPYRLNFLAISIVRISQFLVLPKKRDCSHYILALGSYL